MKKVILTIAALLVSASMVFAFAGCTADDVVNEDNSDQAVVTEADSVAPVADVTDEAVTT